jgi:threonine dehydrogenase-like Zn-dependent dehydrogenase
VRAMVLKAPRTLVVEEIPEFDLAPDEVMVETASCGICGSDLRYYAGENPWAQQTLGRFVPNPPNIVPGHEFCGRVVSVGSNVDASWEGRRVVVMPIQVCGECDRCRAGYTNLCINMRHLGHGGGWAERPYYPGGMARRCPVWMTSCFDLPYHIPDDEAALMDMLGVAVHAVSLAQPAPDDMVAVIGSGPIGLSIAQVARAHGAKRVLLFDPSVTARSVAEACGMEEVFDVPDRDIAAAMAPVREAGGAAYVFDTVGSPATLQAALGALRYGGELIAMATHDDPLPFSMIDVGQERRIRTSCNFRVPADFRKAIDLTAGGHVKLGPYVTRTVALDDGPAAFESLARDRQWAFKCVIHPQR